MILKATDFDKYMSGIGSYVNALNLLLNALQWSVSRNSDVAILMLSSRSQLEQQGLLSSLEAQGIIETMEDETSSLFCIADDRSIASRGTSMSEASAALSISFGVDREILGSKVYAIAYRSHLR